MVHTETMSPLPLPVMICVDSPGFYPIGKGVTSICKAGTPTGKILLTSVKNAIGRMDLQLNVESKTMVNGGVISITFPHSHNITFSADVCFNLGTNKSTQPYILAGITVL